MAYHPTWRASYQAPWLGYPRVQTKRTYGKQPASVSLSDQAVQPCRQSLVPSKSRSTGKTPRKQSTSSFTNPPWLAIIWATKHGWLPTYSRNACPFFSRVFSPASKPHPKWQTRISIHGPNTPRILTILAPSPLPLHPHVPTSSNSAPEPASSA